MKKKLLILIQFAAIIFLFTCAPLAQQVRASEKSPNEAKEWLISNPLGVAVDNLNAFLWDIDQKYHKPISPEQAEIIKEILEEAKSEIVEKALDKHSDYSNPKQKKAEADKNNYTDTGMVLDSDSILDEYIEQLVKIITKNVLNYDFKNASLTNMITDWLAEKNPEAARAKECIQKMIVPENGVLIYKVIENSPAEKAGLKSGWRIIAVDGKKTEDQPLDSVMDQIKGPAGTKVKLTLINGGSSEITLEIIRQVTQIESMRGKMLSPRIGYISFAEFYEGAGKDFKKTIQKLKAENLILDLRNNPGGRVSEAKSIADALIGDGVKVLEKYRGIKKATYHMGEPIFSGKIILLINRYSASSSEIIAAALRDHKRATIIGERSLGKGSIQDVTDLPDGSELRVTTGYWYSPITNECIDGVGIKPDIEIKDDPAAPQDNVLERAIQELNK